MTTPSKRWTQIEEGDYVMKHFMTAQNSMFSCWNFKSNLPQFPKHKDFSSDNKCFAESYMTIDLIANNCLTKWCKYWSSSHSFPNPLEFEYLLPLTCDVLPCKTQPILDFEATREFLEDSVFYLDIIRSILSYSISMSDLAFSSDGVLTPFRWFHIFDICCTFTLWTGSDKCWTVQTFSKMNDFFTLRTCHAISSLNMQWITVTFCINLIGY